MSLSSIKSLSDVDGIGTRLTVSQKTITLLDICIVDLRGKKGRISLLLMSQCQKYVILPSYRDALGLRECYQCGGETLDPVVKH